MLIYTLQFPQVELKNRIEFLDFVQKKVMELALKNEEIFLAEGLTPEYFHKNASLPPRTPENQVPIHIHSILLDGLFTLRAYGEKAVATLQIWSQIFLDENPEYRQHIVKHIENVEIERLEKPIYYTSNNWIAFNRTKVCNGFYIDADIDCEKAMKQTDLKQKPHFALNKQLFNNLRTFLCSHDIKIHRDIELVLYPSKPKNCLALRTRENGKIKKKYKDAFTVKIKTHIRLPMYFSLGQNVAYGNGLFVQC